MSKSLQAQIEEKKAELSRHKPRTHRRIKLLMELQQLTLRKLKQEIRNDRRVA